MTLKQWIKEYIWSVNVPAWILSQHEREKKQNKKVKYNLEETSIQAIYVPNIRRGIFKEKNIQK